MTRLRRAVLRRARRSGWTVAFTAMAALGLFCPLRPLFGWGREGYEVIALIAEHYMTEPAKAKAGNLLDGGSIEDWLLEGHRLAQTVAYGDLGNGNPAPITAAYEQQAGPAIEKQLEKAEVRLAYLLDTALK